jgi:hypothetical protein
MKTFYWSRKPGRVVDRVTGDDLYVGWYGTIAEWYQGLADLCKDVAALDDADTLEVSKPISVILSFTKDFEADLVRDETGHLIADKTKLGDVGQLTVSINPDSKDVIRVCCKNQTLANIKVLDCDI